MAFQARNGRFIAYAPVTGYGWFSVFCKNRLDFHTISGGRGEKMTWIEWFCSLHGNEGVCIVPQDFICMSFPLAVTLPR